MKDPLTYTVDKGSGKIMTQAKKKKTKKTPELMNANEIQSPVAFKFILENMIKSDLKVIPYYKIYQRRNLILRYF